MREAYSGRSAAYEAKGDNARALADHNMVITLLCVELEVLESLEADGRDKLMAEAAAAYRARAKVQVAAGRTKAAVADTTRADKLDGEAKKLAAAQPKAKEPSPQAQELTRELASAQRQLDRMLAAVEQLPATRYQANLAPETIRSARIQIVNAWTGPVTVAVDGMTYSLQVGASLNLTKPAGEFTYEVNQIQAPVKRTLSPGQTFSIRIAPR